MIEELCGDEGGRRKPEFQINTENEYVMKRLRFLKDLLRPWLEPYCVSASCLRLLVGDSMLENEITKEVLKAMKEQLGGTTVSYGEYKKLILVRINMVNNCLTIGFR